MTRRICRTILTRRSSAHGMLALVGDVLDFSKIDAGEMTIDHAPFELRAVLGDAVRGLAQRAHAKGLELVLHVAPGLADVRVGDAARLRQIVVNLVGNAVKFTASGEVVVRAAGDAAAAASW